MHQDIKERTFHFALRIVELVRQLPQDSVGKVVGKQLLRSGTSVGANVEEATAGASKEDFTYKMNIALKEARETHYWLRLLIGSKIIDIKSLQDIEAESEEIKKVLGSIVSKMRGKSKT